MKKDVEYYKNLFNSDNGKEPFFTQRITRNRNSDYVKGMTFKEPKDYTLADLENWDPKKKKEFLEFYEWAKKNDKYHTLEATIKAFLQVDSFLDRIYYLEGQNNGNF